MLSTSLPFSSNPHNSVIPVLRKRKLCPREGKQFAKDQDRGVGLAFNIQLFEAPVCRPTSCCSPQ